MSIHVDIVGIGPGGPDLITVRAIERLRAADAYLLVEKRDQTQDLVDARAAVLDQHVGDWRARAIYVQDPERARRDDPRDQREAVAAWRAERACRFADALREAPPRVAILAWGDPSLYDSTIGVFEDIRLDLGLDLEISVEPGISSIQALAAGHRIGLNRVGGAVQVTTGRRLRAGMPAEADDVVVMLDSSCAFGAIEDEGIDLFWGAYLGTDDEILISGPLPEVAPKVERMRDEAKARKGWVFDTYLLRRR